MEVKSREISLRSKTKFSAGFGITHGSSRRLARAYAFYRIGTLPWRSTLLACCLFIYLSGSRCYSHAHENNQGLISLTFDDGYMSHYDIVLPLLEKYHLPATFYLTTDALGKSEYLQPEHVLEIVKQGHEIGSHSKTHRNLKKLSLKVVDQELKEAKSCLENLVLSPIEHFAPPYGQLDGAIMRLVQNWHQSCRTIMPGLNLLCRLNPYFIKAKVVLCSTTESELGKWIADAQEENKWLVLVYHNISLIEGIVNTPPHVFEGHLMMICSSKVKCLTIGNALNECLKTDPILSP